MNGKQTVKAKRNEPTFNKDDLQVYVTIIHYFYCWKVRNIANFKDAELFSHQFYVGLVSWRIVGRYGCSDLTFCLRDKPTLKGRFL